jgi:serine/threonine-protein kinase ATR
LVSAQCLGKIGAVDPGRLEFQSGDKQTLTSHNFLLDVTSSEFCVKLILELVRAHQSSREPFVLENCMYSIQEVLRQYEIKPSSVFGAGVLESLSDSVREILSPLMSSMYRHNPKPMPQLSFPIYGTGFGKNYRDWLVHFVICLIDNVSDKKAKDIFTACLPALKKDVR